MTNYFLHYLKFTFLIFNLLIFTLSCSWQDLTPSKHLAANIREKRDIYSYKDYRVFKSELKDLVNWRVSLIDDIGKAKGERDNLYSKIESYVTKIKSARESFIKDGISEDTLKKENYLYKRYEDLKTIIKLLQEMSKKENISCEDFLTKVSFIGTTNELTNLTVMFYFIIYRLSIYKLKFIDLKQYHPEFDLNFLREAISRGIKIFLYHFPLLYEDLVFLFEAEYDYFK